MNEKKTKYKFIPPLAENLSKSPSVLELPSQFTSNDNIPYTESQRKIKYPLNLSTRNEIQIEKRELKVLVDIVETRPQVSKVLFYFVLQCELHRC
jgi:hypothetical protein